MKEYVYRYRIALSDTDAGSIVYHSNYISIAERARMEMLREAGVEGKILDAEEVSIEYMRPGLFDDEVCVHSTISEAGEGKCIIRQTIERGDDTLAKLSVHAVLKTFPGLSAEYIPEELTRA